MHILCQRCDCTSGYGSGCGGISSSPPALTFKRAKAASRMTWKMRCKDPFVSNDDIEIAHIMRFDMMFKHCCGFCELYSDCKSCPLFWKGAREEPNSALDFKSLPCCREYWHFQYWYGQHDINDDEESPLIWKRAVYWAKKVLARIEATKEVRQ